MSVLRDILVPQSMLRDPARFGGTPEGDCLRGDLVLREGRPAGLQRAAPGTAPRMILPKLVEPHCHLDKCHTIARLGPVGGDLGTAIAAQRADKAHWTQDDLRSRSLRGLSEAVDAGCGALRTHVDWGDDIDAPASWHLLAGQARDETRLHLQCAALTSIDHMADRSFCDAVALQVARDGGVLGAFVLHHGAIEAGLRNMFASAERHGLALDFHVDEGLGDFNGLEAIADAALATRFEGPILCGHSVSLIDRGPDDFGRIADKLLQAGISVCALPATNLYLQGRRAGTPDRRGITRMGELRTAGVPVLVGSDNVGDAFCPTGAHDPMAALQLAALTAHLDPPYGPWLAAVTTDAAHALGLPRRYVDGAAPDSLLIAPAASTAELVAGRTKPRPFDGCLDAGDGAAVP